jgi:hypothetical protein
MSPCPKEISTCHHLGDGHGHGPVKDNEKVILAVFVDCQTSDNQLTEESIRTKDLKNGHVSIARFNHTTRHELLNHVIEPGKASRGDFVGLVVADASNIRNITFNLTGMAPETRERGLCVLDVVEKDDHDGHASLQYTEALRSISNQTRRGKEFVFVRNELLHVFDQIVSIDDIYRQPLDCDLKGSVDGNPQCDQSAGNG